MTKIEEITKAWINVVTGDQDIKLIAQQRLEVCISCEHKIQFMNADTCGVCYCPLKGKTHSPVNSCPKKKWKE